MKKKIGDFSIREAGKICLSHNNPFGCNGCCFFSDEIDDCKISGNKIEYLDEEIEVQ